MIIKQKQIDIVDFNLSDSYKYDIWDITNFNIYTNSDDKTQQKCLNKYKQLNFTLCENKYIKEEFKYFFYYLFDIKKIKLSTLEKYYYTFLTITKYINLNLLDLNSITQLDNELTEYKSYLIENSFKLQTTSGNAIRKDMTKVKTMHTTKYIMHLKNFISVINDFYKQDLNEFDKDIWDIRNFPFKIDYNVANPRYKINFSDIVQKNIKNTTKILFYQRLKNHPIKTITNELNEIKILSKWLFTTHTDINSLSELNRDIIEEFITYLKTSSGFSQLKVNRILSTLHSFFDRCSLMNLEDKPITNPIYCKDYSYKEKKIVNFYTDEEIQNLNRHISKLPLQIGRMLFIIENAGMRISELCTLTTDCLSVNKKGDYYLTYFQIKTNKDNTVPINETVAESIKAGIENSKIEFGENIKYVFSKTLETPITANIFSTTVNKLCYENKIMNSENKILRIRAHKFRGTVATKYINLGLDINIIRKLLGHSSSHAIYHYIEIHNDTVLKAMKPITEHQDEMIKNIGHIKDASTNIDENKELIPLSNGHCSKPIASGICKHANACLSCKMFKPDINHLSLYESQLKESINNIEISKANDFTRLLEYNIDLKNNLEKIIKKIKGE